MSNDNYIIDTKKYPKIIRIKFKDNYDFTLLDCKDLVDDLKLICADKPKPILKIPGKYSTIDKSVREFISSKEGMQCSAAEAMVTTDLPQRIIGNFYMRVNKPIKPTAFFDTEEKAVEWLKNFI